MIIYYDNKNGKIYGAILGRVHNEFELRPNLIEPRGVNPKDISREVLSVKKTIELEEYLEGNETKVLQCEVVLDKDPDHLFIKKKKPEPNRKPDSVDTITIDLKKDLEDIKIGYSSTTKRWLGASEKENLVFREVPFSEINVVRGVIEELEDMKDIKLAKHLLTVRAAFLDGLRRAYVVENNKKEPLAVAVITTVGNRFIYTLGGVTAEGRGVHAGDFLVHRLIKDAKELGFEIYDVGGIYAEWASDEKKKVNKFKERWGGKVSPLI